MEAELYKQQAEAFLDYAAKLPEKNLTFLFNEWAFSKDFTYLDKQRIWRIVRRLRPARPVLILENSDEFVRIDAVLKLLFEADVKKLEIVLTKRERKKEIVHNVS